ncbi:permease-like cell division protein FtsX [Streptosporangium sp. NPDC023963]|uniref:permease-like cell division protein FtsX n=1 Tax=Streptosporangium sp. NPDC023963 TaxID=3155608 RepID=UPI0034163A33
MAFESYARDSSRLADIVTLVLRVLFAFVAMTALLLGTSAAEANRFPRILASPTEPWPEGGSFFVRLCRQHDARNACEEEVTPAQRRAVEQTLRQMPQITGLRYESKREALVRFLKTVPDLTGAVEESDMSEEFSGRLLRWSDAPAFDSAVKMLPGISIAYARPVPFWEDKADVVIILCNDGRRKHCEGRGRATADEMTAIEALLRKMKGIERIYLADRAHNMWTNERFSALVSQPVERVPQDGDNDAEPRLLKEYYESYYVKLNDPKLVPSIVDAVEDLPGVAGALEVSVWGG